MIISNIYIHVCIYIYTRYWFYMALAHWVASVASRWKKVAEFRSRTLPLEPQDLHSLWKNPSITSHVGSSKMIFHTYPFFLYLNLPIIMNTPMNISIVFQRLLFFKPCICLESWNIHSYIHLYIHYIHYIHYIIKQYLLSPSAFATPGRSEAIGSTGGWGAKCANVEPSTNGVFDIIIYIW